MSTAMESHDQSTQENQIISLLFKNLPEYTLLQITDQQVIFSDLLDKEIRLDKNCLIAAAKEMMQDCYAAFGNCVCQQDLENLL